jgi:hypothetical protein
MLIINNEMIFLGASRILQAVANDNLLGLYSRASICSFMSRICDEKRLTFPSKLFCFSFMFLKNNTFLLLLGSLITRLGRGFGRNNEPVFAVLVSWLCVQVSREGIP